MNRTSALIEFLQQARTDGTFPGAVFLVSEAGRILAEGAIGDAVREPERHPATLETLYDLASLSKPLATALLLARFRAQRKLALDDRLSRHLPEWRPEDLRRGLTLLDLLTHRSGLPAWDPLYVYAADRAGRIDRMQHLPMAHPPLVGVTYSDLNYLLLGFALETVGGSTIDRLFEAECPALTATPALRFKPPANQQGRTAATETGNEKERQMAGVSGDHYNGWRRGVIWGEVHDHNAYTLGGAAGNAGLFGTARGVESLARRFLAKSDDVGLLSSEERGLFGHNFTEGLQQDRSLGFQLAATPGCSAGPALSPRAFGHTGFTGTSLWIDPDAGRVYVLLTNRVHPRYRDLDMNAVRREFHALAAAL